MFSVENWEDIEEYIKRNVCLYIVPKRITVTILTCILLPGYVCAHTYTHTHPHTRIYVPL